MKIWHIGVSPSPRVVDGINTTTWILAREQTLLGHEVTFLLTDRPSEASLERAEQAGIKLVQVSVNTWLYDFKVFRTLLRTAAPQIVHMHSVFIPVQAGLAFHLARNKIPYVVSPHGGVISHVLRRGRTKKSLYSFFVEKQRFSAAAAITLVMPEEEAEVRAYVPNYKGIVRWIPNPVNAQMLEGRQWRGDLAKKQLVFLGRFDVLHKGIDILVAIARLSPDMEFELYGTEDARTKRWLKQLTSDLPRNLSFHRPVYEAEKVEVLTSASMYIQTSRWEAFGNSVAESMYLGVPCAISNTHNLANLFCKHDLGVTLPLDAGAAAIELNKALVDEARLHECAERARAFAHEHFYPRVVATRYLNLYEEVLGMKVDRTMSKAS